MEVPNLLGYLPRNLIGAHGMLIWLLAEAKVEPREDEGEGDTEPHEEESHHGGEGYLGRSGGDRGVVAVSQSVQEGDVLLPMSAVPR